MNFHENERFEIGDGRFEIEPSDGEHPDVTAFRAYARRLNAPFYVMCVIFVIIFWVLRPLVSPMTLVTVVFFTVICVMMWSAWLDLLMEEWIAERRKKMR